MRGLRLVPSAVALCAMMSCSIVHSDKKAAVNADQAVSRMHDDVADLNQARPGGVTFKPWMDHNAVPCDNTSDPARHRLGSIAYGYIGTPSTADQAAVEKAFIAHLSAKGWHKAYEDREVSVDVSMVSPDDFGLIITMIPGQIALTAESPCVSGYDRYQGGATPTSTPASASSPS